MTKLHPSEPSATDVFQLFVDRVADAVVVRLKAPPVEYASRGGQLPPGTTARKFRAECARIAGAYKVGNVWICSRDHWEAHHAAQSAAPSDDSAEAMLASMAGGRQ